jgi:hypothetical protein
MERHAVAEEVLRMTRNLTAAITLDSGGMRAIRNGMAGLLLLIPGVQEEFTDEISEIGLNYRRSPLSEGSHGRVSPGDRAPDAGIAHSKAIGQTRLFEILGEGRLIAIWIAGRHAEKAAAMQRRFEKSYGGRVASIVTASDEIIEKYGAGSGAVLLIRPDGYVAYRSHLDDLSGLSAYLERHFTLG